MGYPDSIYGPAEGQTIVFNEEHHEAAKYCHKPSTVIDLEQNGDPERCRKIKSQIALYLHAGFCRLRENSNPLCTNQKCIDAANILKHLRTCSAGMNCLVPGCLSCRLINNHWKNCYGDYCDTCSPMREGIRNAWRIIRQRRENNGQ